jgi:hypothetical protein
VSVLFAWCLIVATTILHNGLPSYRSPARWAARRKHCLNWVRRHERDTGQRDGLTSAEQQRIKDLEREVKELRKANEILKLASAFFAQAELDRRFKS